MLANALKQMDKLVNEPFMGQALLVCTVRDEGEDNVKQDADEGKGDDRHFDGDKFPRPSVNSGLKWCECAGSILSFHCAELQPPNI